MQSSRPALSKALLEAPGCLTHLFKATPELLAQTLRHDVTVLSQAFVLVPQCLSDVLEKNPEFFVDIAHRKPTLVSRLFSSHPDLLLVRLRTVAIVMANKAFIISDILM